MDDLAASIQKGFEEMDAKIVGLEQRLTEKMDAKIVGLEERLTEKFDDSVTQLKNAVVRRLDLVEDDMRRVKTELHMR